MLKIPGSNSYKQDTMPQIEWPVLSPIPPNQDLATTRNGLLSQLDS